MSKATQLYGYHANHAKLTEFAGYEMPLWYTTTTDEHLAVRNTSGIFDVSHMGRFIVKGPAATSFLEGLVPTDVQSQPAGKAFYTLLLNDRGGIIDDLIIVRISEDRYLLVVNAANAQIDMEHIAGHTPGGLELEDLTATTAMIAVQGPRAFESLQPLTGLDLGQLKRFRSGETKIMGAESLVSRTGYTGEEGFEVIVYDSTNERPEKAMKIWEKLATTSIPCGLGARDSLRLEAGFPLHGSDMDKDTNPFEADLAWVFSAGKVGYVGSDAISEFRKVPPAATRRGLVLGSGIPRHGFDVVDADGEVGTVTSGTFSPILHKGIALARIRQDHSDFGTKVGVLVRESRQEGIIVKPPFYDEQLYGWKRQKGK
ncbi:MAG: glycine cleavage system aminomethyltransferase GcvT [Thaumarchaeota archaeon]|nr:glycine cleavage system aminomethyltransferase GcvT [Nitrososphaerota archaeon]